MGLCNLLILFFASSVAYTYTIELNFSIIGQPITGRCVQYHKSYQESITIQHTLCNRFWTNYFGFNFFGTELKDPTPNSEILNYFYSFTVCLKNPMINERNILRLICSLLQPTCVDVTGPSDVNKTSMVQVVPPCRSLCLELRRSIIPSKLPSSFCSVFLQNCYQYPRPRDSNFVCVPPVFID